jgi:hypothetical protein
MHYYDPTLPCVNYSNYYCTEPDYGYVLSKNAGVSTGVATGLPPFSYHTSCVLLAHLSLTLFWFDNL